MRLCGSELEREFLRWLYQRNLRLPDRSQVQIDAAAARPDFIYDEALTCVYVDGAPHQFPERQRRDEASSVALANLGWTVVRVGGPDSWDTAVGDYAWVFGSGDASQ
jgi:very-short-patch-repair endonuclease